MHSRQTMNSMKPGDRVSRVGDKSRNNDAETSLTEEEPCYEDVAVELVRVGDVADGQEVQLNQPLGARTVQRQQDGPGKDTSSEADGAEHLEVAEEEEAV